MPIYVIGNDGITLCREPLATNLPAQSVGLKTGEAPITVIIGGRALLMLIAARFSGSGSGKDLLGRAISLIASRNFSN
jgi:hypothetical protein